MTCESLFFSNSYTVPRNSQRKIETIDVILYGPASFRCSGDNHYFSIKVPSLFRTTGMLRDREVPLFSHCRWETEAQNLCNASAISEDTGEVTGKVPQYSYSASTLPNSHLFGTSRSTFGQASNFPEVPLWIPQHCFRVRGHGDGATQSITSSAKDSTHTLSPAR